MNRLETIWLHQCRVLVVDGDRPSHRLVARYLAELGVEVTCRDDAETAVEAALQAVEVERQPYDFILLAESSTNWNGSDPCRIFGWLNPAPALIFGSDGTDAASARSFDPAGEHYHVELGPDRMGDLLSVLCQHGFLRAEAALDDSPKQRLADAMIRLGDSPPLLL